MDSLSSTDIVLFEEFRLDRRRGALFRRDELGVFAPIAMGSRALEILGTLVERSGDLVSRAEIMDAVWPETAVDDSNLNVQIAALRRVLDQGRTDGSCIQTVPGRGYRFVSPVTRLEPVAPSPVPVRSLAEGSDGHVAEPKYQEDPGALGQPRSIPIAAPPDRHWLFGVLAALVGAMGLFAVVVAGIWYLPWWEQTRLAPRLSIVVLPFADISGDHGQQYFADGLTDDLTTDLSRIKDMFVISRNTAFTYQNKPVNIKEIGHELGVRYVLEGSVLRSGGHVRVNSQLIDASTDAHVWVERFDQDTTDLFVLEDEITRRLAYALGAELVRQEAARPSEHPDALDYTLRAIAAIRSEPRTRDNWDKVISLYERALSLDPGSVAAQSRLAGALTVRRSTDDLQRAEKLIGQALQASPRSSLAHFAKGQLLRAQHRDEEAIPEYEMVLETDRNWVSAIGNLAWCKIQTGSLEEAIPLLDLAIRLGPRDPDLVYWYNGIGVVQLLRSHTDEAILWLEKARAANSEVSNTHAYLASAYGLKGAPKHAAAELAEARRLPGSRDYSSIARLRAEYWGGVRRSAVCGKQLISSAYARPGFQRTEYSQIMRISLDLCSERKARKGSTAGLKGKEESCTIAPDGFVRCQCPKRATVLTDCQPPGSSSAATWFSRS